MNYSDFHHRIRTGTHRSRTLLKELIKIADERGRIESSVERISKEIFLGIHTIRSGLKRLQREGYVNCTASDDADERVSIQLSDSIVDSAKGPAHDPRRVPKTTFTEFVNSVIESHARPEDSNAPRQ